jgi:uncharacterized membrane protein
MTPDSGIAIGVFSVLFAFIVLPHFAEPFLDFFLFAGLQISSIVLLSGIVLAYLRDYKQTAVVLTLFLAYLLPIMWTTYPRSDSRRLRRDITKDQARFEEKNSIDLQFANGSVIHDSPNMLAKNVNYEPLIVFPPSEEVKHQLNG